MLRISPQANQFILPSPQPLSMLLQGYGSSSSRSSNSGSSNGDEEYKMLPGNKLSYSMAQRNLEADYQSKLNKVFNEGLQSDEGWQTYLRSDSVINELQGYHQEYQNKKIELDSQKDHLEKNLDRYTNQEKYLYDENKLTDSSYTFDNSGRINGNVGQLMNMNLNSDYTQPFQQYTVPDKEGLYKALERNLDKAAKDQTFITTSEIYSSGEIGQGKGLQKTGEEVTTKKFSLNGNEWVLNERALESAYKSFLSEVNNDEVLARAFNSLQSVFNLNEKVRKANAIMDNEEFIPNDFEQDFIGNKIDLRRVYSRDQKTKDLTTINTGSSLDEVKSNYPANVLLNDPLSLGAVANFSRWDRKDRTNLVSQIPSLYNNPRIRELDDNYSKVVDAILDGDGNALLSYSEDPENSNLVSFLTDNGEYTKLTNAITEADKLGLEKTSDLYRSAVVNFMYNTKNEFFANELTEEELAGVNQKIFGLEDINAILEQLPYDPIKKKRLDPDSYDQYSIDAIINTESKKRKKEQGSDFNLKDDRELMTARRVELKSLLDSYRENKEIAEKGLTFADDPFKNYTVREQIRYADKTVAHHLNNEEFINSSLWLKKLDSDYKFIGNYIPKKDLVSKTGKEPVMISTAGWSYADAPWNGIKRPQQMVEIMVSREDEDILENIPFTLPDHNNKLQTKTLDDIDKDDYINYGLKESLVTAELASYLARKGNTDWKEGDKIYIIKGNVPWDEIIYDIKREGLSDEAWKILKERKQIEARNEASESGYDQTSNPLPEKQ